MNTRTSLGLFVATALATRLLGGGAPQDADVAPRPAPVQPVTAAPTASFTFSDELRERLNRRVTPDRGRNPFMYGSRHVAPESRRDEVALPPVEMPPAPIAPPVPQIKLSGVATSLVDGTAVLTAIVIDNGAMVFVKAGDKLPSGATVVRVDELSMTLVDAAGVTQTVRLP
jgi:hypothetical protein